MSPSFSSTSDTSKDGECFCLAFTEIEFDTAGAAFSFGSPDNVADSSRYLGSLAERGKYRYIVGPGWLGAALSSICDTSRQACLFKPGREPFQKGRLNELKKHIRSRRAWHGACCRQVQTP